MSLVAAPAVEDQNLEDARRYWARTISQLDPLIELPLHRQRPARRVLERGTETHNIASELVERFEGLLAQVARDASPAAHASVADGLLAIFVMLLSRYSGSYRFALGLPNGNGAWLPCAIGLEPGDRLPEVLAKLAERRALSRSHCLLGLEEIVGCSGVQRDPAYHPIFQVAAHCPEPGPHGVAAREVVRPDARALDLVLEMTITGTGVRLDVEFNNSILDRATVKRLLCNYETLLDAACLDSNAPFTRLRYVSDAEIALCASFQGPRVPCAETDFVHTLFEAQVRRTPGNLAYVFEGKEYTYAQYNAACNRLARFLRTRGIGPDLGVGLFVPRSEWIGIGAIATFKSGAVHVPLDPAYPSERLRYMLEIAAPKIVLTVQAVRHLLPATNAEVIVLDDLAALAEEYSGDDPAVPLDAANAAYIFFTSGTTGLPKGIRMSHRAFRNMALSHRSAGLPRQENRTLQFASHSFAVCLGGSFMAWLGGGAVFQTNEEQSIPGPALLQLLLEKRINMVSWPVSLLATFPNVDLPDLETVISAAEPCTDFIVQKWARPGRRFINMYGSSEVAMGSTLFEWKPGKPLSMGRPFPNTELYLLDEHFAQVPIGVIGEIHTSGVALADGYVGQPDLTAERFRPNPFDNASGSRIYGSGDLGRYLPNGEIQYVGRKDFQVNIRGFRVELFEIERRLLALETVKEAAVTARPDKNGSQRLVAYIVPKRMTTRAAIREPLLATLPLYMVPSIYVFLDAMPLTPNRKLDRLRLPEPDLASQMDEGYVAPKSAEEKFLVDLWAELLGLECVGTAHNFFEIGGHSLVVAEMISRIKERTRTLLPIAAVFEHPTIAGLAALFELPEPSTA